MSDPQNTRGTPGQNEEADTASGGAPERPDDGHPQTTAAATDGDDDGAEDDGAAQ